MNNTSALTERPRRGTHIIYDDGDNPPTEYVVKGPYKNSRSIIWIRDIKTDETTVVIWKFKDGPNKYLSKIGG